MDNDDIPVDSLSGGAELVHRTNVMHVQHYRTCEKKYKLPS